MRRAPAFLAGVAALALLGGCSGVLDSVGPVGRNDSVILIDALAIMLAIVIPTLLLTVWVAWRYRASNTKAPYLPEWAFSGRIEAIVWSIPALVIIFLGGVIWIGCHQLDPARPLPSRNAPLDVQVVSLDWKWLFIYPGQGVASVNHLVVPAGTPVRFSITSASVMNVFFAPRLGSMIYAMNGMTTHLNLQADRPGRTMGESAQFSGDGFSDMRFDVDSVAPDQFVAWAAQARRSGPVLDQAAFLELEQQSQNVAPYTYRAVDPGLFLAVATQKTPPGPGPTPPSAAHAGRETMPASLPSHPET